MAALRQSNYEDASRHLPLNRREVSRDKKSPGQVSAGGADKNRPPPHCPGHMAGAIKMPSYGSESQGPRPGLRCFVFIIESRTQTARQSAGNTQTPPIWRAPGIRSRSTQTRCLDRPHAAASSAAEIIVAGGSPASPDPKVPQLGGGSSVIILPPDGED